MQRRERITLVQLNIELDKHLDRIQHFFLTEQPEVACVQELYEADCKSLEEAFGGTCFFTPTTYFQDGGSMRAVGNAIFSRLPIKRQSARWYGGNEIPGVVYDPTTREAKHRTQGYALSSCEVEKNGVDFRITTTHFPWTPDGQADDFQRRDLRRLLGILAQLEEFVLCGDFNAPRGGEIFSELAAKYKDNIPQEYTSSIDGTIHKKGPMDILVDGIFSTPDYRVSNIRQTCGLSDHCAFIASVEKL